MQILRTVHSKVVALILLFLLLVLASFLATYLTVQAHFGDEGIIELVHNQIPQVQQLSWLALSGGNQVEINTALSEIDQTLEGMRATLSQLNTYIPIPGSDDLQSHLNSFDASWGVYRLALDSLSALSLQDASRLQAEQNLRAATLQMFVQIQALSHALESLSNSQHALLLRLQVIFVIMTTLCMFLGYLLIRQRVVKPLSILNIATQRVEQGVLTESLEISGEDEIAQLARSFDQMRAAVLAYQTDLERRIGERTSEILTAFEFSQEIVAQHDINALVQSAIAKSRVLMRAREASLCLVTPDGCSVELASTTSAHAHGKKLVQPVGDNLPDMVISRGQALASQVSSFGCAFLQHTPEDQCLSAPLHVGEQVIGAMCVIRAVDQPFSEEESRAFSLLANSAAIAILNARYEEHARQQAREAAILSERERLASELHDNLAQTLNLVNMKVSQLERQVLPPANQVAQNDVAVVKTNVQTAIEQLRMLASEMASATRLPEDGFLTQLEEKVKAFQAASGVAVDLTGTELPLDRLSALVQSQLLMIISEALTNIQRHAGAGQVGIHFSLDQDSLHAIIADDGKGFRPESAQGDQHLGLRIMHTRAKRSGGSLSLTSAPGAGTRVTVCFPLAAQEPG
ncbi:MAG: HAMP domain-containing protein [Anaerolineales bacterium]|nr:MAG: HAMP domain-containing protein [Anaerolineales bacterium]